MNDEKEMLFGDKKMSRRDIFRHSLPYVKKKWLAIVLALILIVIQVGISMVLPMLSSRFIGVLKDETGNVALSAALGFVWGYLALGLVDQAILYVQSIILQNAGQDIVYELRMEVFTHIENMSQNQFNQMPVGSLVTRVCNYTAAVSDLFTSVLVRLLQNLGMAIGVLCIMMAISIRLSLYLLIFALVAGVVSFIFRKVVGKIFRKERGYISDLNAFLSENLSGMRITQIFNRQKRKLDEFDVKNQNIRKASYQVVIAFAFYRPFINLLYFGSIATTFYVGLRLNLTAAEIVAFYLYLSRFFNPIQSIADQLNQISRAMTAAERLFNLLDVPPDIVDRPEARKWITSKGALNSITSISLTKARTGS